jgi:polyhydroxybutyrate depolymerase
MSLSSRLTSVRSSLVLVPAALATLLLAGWSRANLMAAGVPSDPGTLRTAGIVFPHQGRVRTAELVVPTGTPPAAGWPVVLLLHGAGGSAHQALEKNGWQSVATREHFAIVAADGTPKNEGRRAVFIGNPRTWNSGTGSGLSVTDGSAVAKEIDDVGYLVALLDSAAKRTRLDIRRVYVAGHSNGAGMSYRFASEHPERVAAVGVMAGHLFSQARQTLPTPVPLLQIIGDQDPLLPMDGGRVKLGSATATLEPALASPMRWASMLGIHDSARIVRDDSVTVRQWGDASSNAVVMSYVVKGHGHGWLWPNADRLPESVIGPRRESLNATETMWAFFAGHARD